MMKMNPAHMKMTGSHSFPAVAFCAALDRNASRLYLGASDFGVHEVDWSQEKPEINLFQGEGHSSYVTGMAILANRVVTCGYDGRLIWWDLEKRKSSRHVDAHQLWARNVVATPDQTRLCSVADDMVCRVWDADNGKVIHELRGHENLTPHHYPSMLYTCTVSEDNRFLATGDRIGHVVVWDLETGKKLSTLETPVLYTWDPRQRRHSIGGVRSLQFSPDSRLLAVGGIGKIGNIDHLGGPSRLEVFDWQKGERLHETENGKFKGLIERLSFAKDGTWLCAAGGDNGGFVTFYAPESGEIIHQDKAPMHVHDFVFSEDSSSMFAVGHEKLARFDFPAPEPETESEQK